ncbi:MAG: hypothetical protein ACTSR7_19535 [Promethearchaeota archaeon]
MTKPKVYLDTSAYNYILLNYPVNEVIYTLKNNYEVYFSSCNLDEFGICEPEISSKLAIFSHAISNQKKLLDHIELITHEMLYELGKTSDFDYFDINDTGFYEVWELMRRKCLPQMFIDSTVKIIRSHKELHREHEREMRKLFVKEFESINVDRKEIMKTLWLKILNDLENEGWIKNFFINNLYNFYSDFKKLISLDELKSIDYKHLKGTAPGLQYYFALQYIQCYQSGKMSKPDLGDQVDIRHTFYAGIVDYFITNDSRMYDIFNNYIIAPHGDVVKPKDFIDNYVIEK